MILVDHKKDPQIGNTCIQRGSFFFLNAKFTGQVPEWSDSEEPAQVGTCDLPVIKWQVLGLPFSTAIFRTLPITFILYFQ